MFNIYLATTQFDMLVSFIMFSSLLLASHFSIVELADTSDIVLSFLLPLSVYLAWRFLSRTKPWRRQPKGAFSKFTLLPADVQEKIWEFALHDRDGPSYIFSGEIIPADRFEKNPYQFSMCGLRQVHEMAPYMPVHRLPRITNLVPLPILLRTCRLSREVASRHLHGVLEDVANLHEEALKKVPGLTSGERYMLRDQFIVAEIDGPEDLGVFTARNQLASHGRFHVAPLPSDLPRGTHLSDRVVIFWPPADSPDPNENIMSLVEIILDMEKDPVF